jgi:hypothetical protein
MGEFEKERVKFGNNGKYVIFEDEQENDDEDVLMHLA